MHPVPRYRLTVAYVDGDDIVLLRNTWVAPDACTLPTVEQPLRVAEFDELFAHHMSVLERVTPTRLVLTLTGPADLAAQVKDLTDRESSCCSFFTFTLTTEGPADDMGRVRLEVEVPAAQIEVLDALAERADTSRQWGPV